MMKYKILGRSGLRVSELCLGAMTFGNAGWGATAEEAQDVYAAFRDRGGNFIDTANEAYAGGASEEILGRLVADHRDEMVVATKYSLQFPKTPNLNAFGNHRKSLVRSVEHSLKRLSTDYIDLLWLHAWDFVTPADEVMRSLDLLVQQGKILYAGISNAPAWVVAQCNTLADGRGWTPFIGVQAEYSLIERGVEREILPMARALDLAVLAWSPLASGILTGKYAGGGAEGGKRLDVAPLRRIDPRAVSIAEAVAEVAAEIGQGSAAVAINWARARGNVIPILGARTRAQLEDNLRCLDFSLSDDHLARLDQASAIALGYPHDYFSKIGPLLFGKAVDTLVRHRDQGMGVS